MKSKGDRDRQGERHRVREKQRERDRDIEIKKIQSQKEGLKRQIEGWNKKKKMEEEMIKRVKERD